MDLREILNVSDKPLNKMEQKELPTVENCPCPHCVEVRRQRIRLAEYQATKKPLTECPALEV